MIAASFEENMSLIMQPPPASSRIPSPHIILWGATVSLAVHPGVFLSHLSYKPLHLPPDEMLASQAKMGRAPKAESRVPLL